jgi:hypothetical protein
MVLFPTPPFALDTAMTRFTCGIRDFMGIPPFLGIRGGGSLNLGAAYLFHVHQMYD